MRRPIIAGRSVRTTVSTSGSSGILFGEVHQNLPGLDADRICRYPQSVVEQTRAGGGIEFKRVPRTGHDGAVERPLSKRTPLMRADPGHRANLTGHVAESIEVFALDDFDQGAFGQLIEGCKFSVGHSGIDFPV